MPSMIKEKIEEKLQNALAPQFMEVINESSKHRVPPGSETHFKVVLASDRLAGKSIVERHQAVYQALSEEMARGIHALSIQAFTPEEWEKRQGRFAPSPKCLGGDKGGH